MRALSPAIFKSIERDLSRPGFCCLTLKTYKGDRGLVLRIEDAGFSVLEFGFEPQERKGLCLAELLKFCKKAIKREFPRSHKIQYHLDLMP